MSFCHSMNTIADTFTLVAPRWAQSLIHSHFSKLFHWNHWFFIVHSHFSASQANPWFSLGFLKIDQTSLFQNADTVALVLHLDLQSMDTFALFLYHFFIHQQNQAKSLIHSHFSQGLQISINENEQKRWYIRVFWLRSYFLTTSLAVCDEREQKNKRNHRFWNLTHTKVDHLSCQIASAPKLAVRGSGTRDTPVLLPHCDDFASVFIQRKP